MKRIIPQRRRIFIAAEGESEQSFLKWLQLLSDRQELFIHLDCQPLGGGGYKRMFEKAIRERKRKERHQSGVSILLVDSDRADQYDDGWSLIELRKKASAQFLEVCVQTPNLEGVLFRMLPGNERASFSEVKANHRLLQAWPAYQKPVDARTLDLKFSLDDLLRVATVNTELKKLLSIIGLING